MRLTARGSAALAAVLSFGALVSCTLGGSVQPEPTAEELLLRRQVEGLRNLVAAASRGSLAQFDQMLVVVNQGLVQELLAGVAPLEGDVGGGFHVRIESAQAQFGEGLALVSLAGSARLVEGAAQASVVVHGGLDVVNLDPKSGMLRARVSVFAVDIPKADVLGMDQPARRLLEALAEGGLETLLGPIEVPVRVANRLSFPAVRGQRLTIARLDLPIEVAVSSVRVFDGRLWIGLRGRLPEPGPQCRARDAA